MIVPSIDIMNGQAVQLVEGRILEIEAGDPRPIAERFAPVGEIAVIDLDAALGTGSNKELIRELLRIAPCRVGGGIRDLETATRWLDAGAEKIIIGTAASPELLAQLPRERVIAALDARNDSVVVEGWQKDTGENLYQRIDQLREHVAGFLVTFVEREGHMVGLEEPRIRKIVERAGGARVTVAGGVRAPQDIALADMLGADAQVGMALYSGAFDLTDGFCAPLQSDRPDGLIPTIVTDELGETLGLVYSNTDSIRAALDSRTGIYFSRSRDTLWKKGASSGNTQQLIRIETDCDRDALRFVVRQLGNGFCHTGSRSCFQVDSALGKLERTIRSRIDDAPEGSYTRRLLDNPDLLRAKLVEEAEELAESESPPEANREAADLVYFTLVALLNQGGSVAEVLDTLADRAKKVTRRPGDAKPARTGAIT